MALRKDKNSFEWHELQSLSMKKELWKANEKRTQLEDFNRLISLTLNNFSQHFEDASEH